MDYYVVDVFTKRIFGGNPAGVCVLEDWPDDEILQNIAVENNLSETAFVSRRDGYRRLRWFTPEVEIDLCGHATIGTTFVLMNFYEKQRLEFRFDTMSGEVGVSREGDVYYLDFPARVAAKAPDYPAFGRAFGCANQGVLKAADFLVLFENEAQIRALKPDFAALKALKGEAGLESDNFGVIVTAKGDGCDFVSRFFVPNAGIGEDPVTGRAHCTLIPYWASMLGKAKMSARQLSRRGGEISCELCGERVRIGAKAVLYSKGEIYPA